MIFDFSENSHPALPNGFALLSAFFRRRCKWLLEWLNHRIGF
jgi:hypothetical protein